MSDGKIKIERGDIEDGLTNLRSAWEIFIQELVKRKDETPSQQNKIKKNLKILQEKGYLNSDSGTLVWSGGTKKIWDFLSAKPVHGREKINLTDAKYLFRIIEESMDYLIDKVLLNI